MISAIIYIPPDLPDDQPTANDCLTHLQRRNYNLFAILRDWDLVLWALTDGRASTVVLARQEHAATELPVPVEIVGEATRRISANERPAPALRAARRDLAKLFVALIVATVGASLMWVGLGAVKLAVEWPLYLLVWLVLAAWVPLIGIGVGQAWANDLGEATAWGLVAGYRDGYADGFVDCVTIRDA